MVLKTDEMSDKRLFYGQQKSSRPSLTPCDTMWSWSARLIDIPTATADAKTETGLASEDRAHIGLKYFIHSPLLWRKVSSSPLQLSSEYSLKFAGQVRSLLSQPMHCTDPLPSALATHSAHAVQV